MLVVVAVVGIAAIGGLKWYRDHAGAAVGEPCNGASSCVKDADCMVAQEGIMPNFGDDGRVGRCMLRCLVDEECGATQRCHEGHCAVEVAVGAACDGFVVCAEFATCLSSVCRATCSQRGDAECSQGTRCQPVNTGAPAIPIIGHYCLP
ncbi:MAG: hypothetical protein RIF41_25700 [Polyangiaceae bacterium]